MSRLLETEIPTEMMDIGDLIESLFSEEPDGRTKEHKEWKDLINKCINKYNELRGTKIYNQVK